MAKLKGVIFGQTNVLMNAGGNVDAATMTEIGKLVAFLRSQNVKPVVFANHDSWVHHGDNPQAQRLQDVFTEVIGDFPWYIAQRDQFPWKPKREAIEHVLKSEGWEPNEVICVGNTKDDMLSALHGKVLFVNATWFGKHTDYGFCFETPLEVARFIDTFCLRERHWGFSIPKPEVYALATFSTYKADFADYSEDARASAKSDGRHLDFWLKYLVSSVYFSGLYRRINFVASFPGHAGGAGNPKMAELLEVFAKCFVSMGYLDDLIVRHKPSIKSQTNRGLASHANQLDSIHLTKLPTKYGKPYKHSPLASGKTVLVVDDFCTEGFALEAARAFLSAARVDVISIAWLKTINTAYAELAPFAKFDPYKPQSFGKPTVKAFHAYAEHVVDKHGAAGELNAKLAKYDSWKWPPGL